MSKIKLRNAFVFDGKMSLKLMRNYITKAIKIPVFSSVYVSGELTRDSIAVFEKKFALLEELKDVEWVNYYDETVELLESILACVTMQVGQRPEDVLSYLKRVKNAIDVPNLWKKEFNHFGENAFCLFTLGLDQEEKVQKLREFVESEGMGPFKEMYPLSSTGKVLDKPFVKIKK